MSVNTDDGVGALCITGSYLTRPQFVRKDSRPLFSPCRGVTAIRELFMVPKPDTSLLASERRARFLPER